MIILRHLTDLNVKERADDNQGQLRNNQGQLRNNQGQLCISDRSLMELFGVELSTLELE